MMKARLPLIVGMIVTSIFIPALVSQQRSGLPERDSSTIGSDGTAYITRIVPVPSTISPAARKLLARPVSDAPHPMPPIPQFRLQIEKWIPGQIDQVKRFYPATLISESIGGVPVRVVTPLTISASKKSVVLMNLHSGGFQADTGSIAESFPIANLTGIRVVSVLYRMAPEHPFPAAVDDAVAVYKELLKHYRAEHIGIFGSSAGAILTSEVTVKLKLLHLPLPGVTGIFSGWGDLANFGDSWAMYGLNGLSGHLDPPALNSDDMNEGNITSYIGTTDKKDPVLSPVYANLAGFPPTLFITSGRDFLLSGTTILQRAYLRAGVETQLVVFEALPHTFWGNLDLPESREAFRIMSSFLEKHLTK